MEGVKGKEKEKGREGKKGKMEFHRLYFYNLTTEHTLYCNLKSTCSSMLFMVLHNPRAKPITNKQLMGCEAQLT